MERFLTLPVITDLIVNVESVPFDQGTCLGRGQECSVFEVYEKNGEEPQSDTDTFEEGSDEDKTEDPSNVYYDNELFVSLDSDSTSESSGRSSDDDMQEEQNDMLGWSMVTTTSKNKRREQQFESVLGQSAAAVKVFRHLQYQKAFEIRSADGKSLGTRTCEDMHRLCKHQTTITLEPVDVRNTSTAFCQRTFEHEVTVHRIVSQLTSVSPHVVQFFAAYRKNNTGYLVMERVTDTMANLVSTDLHLWTSDCFASLYVSLCFTIHLYQRAGSFKHNDLHWSNVFLKKIDANTTWRSTLLHEATHFSYTLDDSTTFYVPNTGYIVKLGDFSCSSLNYRGRRYQPLRPFETTRSRGSRNNKFIGNEGYDLQGLFSEPPFLWSSPLVNDNEIRSLMRGIRDASSGSNGRLTKDRFPACGYVSQVTPDLILRSVFSSYTHEPPGEHVKIVSLGSMRDITVSEAMKIRRGRPIRG